MKTKGTELGNDRDFIVDSRNTNWLIVIRDPEDSRFDLEAFLNDVAARNK